MKILIGIIILIFLIQCSKSNSNSLDKNFQALILNIWDSTTYKECDPKNWTNPFTFTDLRGDIKVSSFQSLSDEINILDIIGGKITKTTTEFKMELNFPSLPDKIIVNRARVNSEPEYEWTFHFYKNSDTYTIGIIYFARGDIKKISFTNFNTYVLKNSISIGACAFPIVSENTISFNCDINSLPELKSINETYTFNVRSKMRTASNLFLDCY